MPKTTITPDQLRAQADEVERLAAEARAKADAAAVADAERRRVARLAVRAKRLADFDAVEHEAKVNAARLAFEAAILDDRPAFGEFLSLCQARAAWHLAAVEAKSAQAEAGDDGATTISVPDGGPPIYSEVLQAVLAREASNRLADLQDALQVELTEAGA